MVTLGDYVYADKADQPAREYYGAKRNSGKTKSPESDKSERDQFYKNQNDLLMDEAFPKQAIERRAHEGSQSTSPSKDDN